MTPHDLTLHIKTFDQLIATELYAILKLRSEVFVVEQASIYNDPDDKDQVAYHVWFTQGDNITAYLRVLPSGVSYPEHAIGRVIAVNRGTGMGKRIMQAGIAVAQEKYQATNIRIAAQTHAQGFYEKLGFTPDGEGFELDGIPHVEMLLSL